MSLKQSITLAIDYLAYCQKVAEFIGSVEGGRIVEQRFNKFMLEGDSFAIDSVLHLLSEIIQPVLP